ncbi:hypothetical protein AB6A23_03925 [Paenibacillus tarimensis]
MNEGGAYVCEKVSMAYTYGLEDAKVGRKIDQAKSYPGKGE